MEIIKLEEKSFKIKGKNAVFVINPEKKIDGDVVVLTQKPSSYSHFQGKLVIDGPGEYEVAGVSIKGERIGDNISFDFIEDFQALSVLSSASIAKDKELQDYTAVVVLADEGEKIDFSALASEVIITVGANNFESGTDVKKTDKINLKKIEEFKGAITNLAK